MRILFVSPYVPSVVRVRPYQWIRALARLGHEVDLIALQPPEDQWLSGVPVRECCRSVQLFPLSRARTLLNGATALPRNLPLQAAYSLHGAAERAVAAAAPRCDVIHVEHLRGSLLTRRVGDVPRVLDAVDSITALFEQTQHQARTWQHRLMARADLRRTRRFEAGLCDRFDRLVVSSARDAQAFGALTGSRGAAVTAVPNGVDLDYFRPGEGPGAPPTVLFTGKLSYHANEAAALRLVERIMPLVWRHRSDVRVVLAGKDPGAALRLLATDPRVTVTGYVDDLRPFFWSATVVAAPLVYATGIQNKVLEAMACGVAVVASPKACDGIGAVQGRDLLIGADDDGIARDIVKLLEDTELRQRSAAAGRRYVETHHDWSRLGESLVDVYREARAARRRCA
jgi:polysaccharide biosynthesis protein PslH